MGKKIHVAEETMINLRQAGILTVQGRTVAEAIGEVSVIEVTKVEPFINTALNRCHRVNYCNWDASGADLP